MTNIANQEIEYLLGKLKKVEETVPITKNSMALGKNAVGVLFYIESLVIGQDTPKEFFGNIDDVIRFFPELKNNLTAETVTEKLKGQLILFKKKNFKYNNEVKVESSIIQIENDERFDLSSPISFSQITRIYAKPIKSKKQLLAVVQDKVGLVIVNNDMYFIEKNQNNVIRKTPVSQEILNQFYKVDEMLLFAETEYYKKLSCLIQEMGEVVTNTNYQETLSLKEVDMESNFIASFLSKVNNTNVILEERDAVNIHTCIKTSNITVLDAPSGAGRQRIIDSYLSALEIGSEGICLIEAAPSILNLESLLGRIRGEIFVPSPYGLAEFFISASNAPTKPFFLVVNHLENTQTEYWLDQLLEILDRTKDSRKIRLYSPKAQCHNGYNFPPEITLGENIFIIATINTSEALREISETVLEKANIIKLPVVLFPPKSESASLPQVQNASTLFLQEWVKRGQSEVDFIETQFFMEINKILVPLGKSLSPRAVREVFEYIHAIPLKGGEPMISRQVAFDLQFKQRILTKIKGQAEVMWHWVGGRQSADTTPLAEILGRYEKSISKFEESKNEIARKKNMVMTYGYTY